MSSDHRPESPAQARVTPAAAPAAASATAESDVAIIGMAGRFPGAPDLDAYWTLLRDGIEGVRVLADDELDVPIPPDGPSPSWIRAGGVLDGIDQFDAAFFQIPPSDADWMDPQHRLFLECAWQALEDAGYAPDAVACPVSVYAGANLNSYLASRVHRLSAGDQGRFFQALLGNQADFLATRVAYRLNLRGEAITVQTSCSTSLVAVHLACQSLLSGQSDMALAGGVSVRVPHRSGYVYEEGMITSPDGHCRAFDRRAHGTLPGSGLGVVVLKRAADALRDGDHCYAAIKGSWINNDGRAKAGFTAPSPAGQAEVIARALAMADVDADTIGFVEAHGTGTPVGDPIEVQALTRVFRRQTSRRGFCALGSVKSNLGHLDTAAGMAGLIKTVLSLVHAEIPPTLHFEAPNPALALDESPFYVNATLRPWPATTGLPRRAAVSSFGIGGTNAHVVLEEAPRCAAPAASGAASASSSRDAFVVPLSARTANALARSAGRLADHLDARLTLPIAHVAFTQAVGRTAFAHRACASGRDTASIVRTLRSLAARSDHPRAAARAPGVVFLFPGQGSLRPNAARRIYETEPDFRAHVDEAFSAIPSSGGAALDPPLPRVLFPASGEEAAAAPLLAQPRYTLPALLALEYAFARLWMSWGVTPQALLGHSWGEYVAACVAGVWTLADAAGIALARGRLLERMPPGGMLAVPAASDALRDLLTDGLELAAVNGRSRSVLSGSPEALARGERRLAAARIASSRLDVPYAYHSRFVEPLLDDLRARLAGITLRAPSIPLISNLTGEWIEAARVTSPDYWIAQMRQPVQFAAGLDCVTRGERPVFIEVGPDHILSSLTRQHLGSEACIVASTAAGRRREEDTGTLAASLGRVWTQGVAVDWPAYHRHEQRRRVPLPTYPFERQRHWIDAGRPPFAAAPASAPASASAQQPADAETSHHAIEPVAEVAASSRTSHRQPLDRARLPEPYVAPQTPLEAQLAEIWADVLGVDGIGMADHFIDLGGDSLIATRVFLRIQASCGRVVDLADLLAAPSVGALAALVAAAAPAVRTDDRSTDEEAAEDYCAFELRLGDEDVTVRMSAADYAEHGLPEGARNFRLLKQDVR